MTSEFLNTSIAILLLRTVTGILFFFQGYDKLFNIKIDNVVRTMDEPLSKVHIPSFLIKPAITVASLIELICGLLLFFGLFKDVSMHLLAADLIFVAFIFSSVKPMWDMQFYFPRILFLVILLFIQGPADIFSMDYFLNQKLK